MADIGDGNDLLRVIEDLFSSVFDVDRCLRSAVVCWPYNPGAQIKARLNFNALGSDSVGTVR